MHAEGIKRLKECYGRGLHRIKLIYNQEVLKTEKINTVGRRAKEIVVTKYKDIQIEKRNKRKRAVEDTNSIEILNPQQESLLTDKSKASSKKRIRRMPSKEAIQILLPMVKHPNPPTDEEIQNYLDVLAENIPSSDVWDKHRIIQHYRNRHKKGIINREEEE
jgi:hypothetical protein